MSLRERLAKANWELNLFLKTGRFPRDGYKLSPSNNPHRNPYQPRTIPHFGTNIYNGIREAQYFPNGTAMQATRKRCDKCGSEVSIRAVYCHVCGSKTM